MNLFNFLRFANIEKKAKDDKVLFRLAQKKNGNFVLVNDKGNIVSEEFEWISRQVENIRLAENNGILTYIVNDNGLAKNTALVRITNDSQEKPEIYASADENGMTQVFFNGEKNGTFVVNSHKLSKVFDNLTAPNKKGFRIGWTADQAEILSTDAREVVETFDSISEPDANGVRIAVKEPKPEPERTGLLANFDFPPQISGVALIPVNFDKNLPIYKDVKAYEDTNYIAVLQNDKQVLLNKNGNNIAGGMYHNINEVNALGEVVANRTKSKSKGGIVLIHEGKHFKKVADPHAVIDAAPIGIKALKYGQELNKNVVAGVNIANGIEIDEDVNRVLIALLKGEKPKARFLKSIEEKDKFEELFAGVGAYSEKLDEIAAYKPELEIEIAMKKQNLSKSLTTLLKRKAAGHRTYENVQKNKIKTKKTEIVGHKQNISNSSNIRQKLTDVAENLEQSK